jgi:hypothetical protein
MTNADTIADLAVNHFMKEQEKGNFPTSIRVMWGFRSIASTCPTLRFSDGNSFYEATLLMHGTDKEIFNRVKDIGKQAVKQLAKKDF